MIEKRNQHVHPAKYYSGFSAEARGRFPLLRGDKKTQRVYPSFADKAFPYPDYHTLDDVEDKYAWDNVYTERIEPVMGDILDKIRDVRITKGEHVEDVISDREKQLLAATIGIQITRGQKFRRLTYSVYRNYGLTNDWDTEENEILDSFFKRAFAEWVTSTACNSPLLMQVHNREWLFYESEERFFITSDEPVVFTNRKGDRQGIDQCPLGAEDTVLVFPVSSTRCLLMMPLGNGDRFYTGRDRMMFVTEDQDYALRCNVAQYENANRHVYSQRDIELRELHVFNEFVHA